MYPLITQKHRIVFVIYSEDKFWIVLVKCCSPAVLLFWYIIILLDLPSAVFIVAYWFQYKPIINLCSSPVFQLYSCLLSICPVLLDQKPFYSQRNMHKLCSWLSVLMFLAERWHLLFPLLSWSLSEYQLNVSLLCRRYICIIIWSHLQYYSYAVICISVWILNVVSSSIIPKNFPIYIQDRSYDKEVITRLFSYRPYIKVSVVISPRQNPLLSPRADNRRSTLIYGSIWKQPCNNL